MDKPPPDTAPHIMPYEDEFGVSQDVIGHKPTTQCICFPTPRLHEGVLYFQHHYLDAVFSRRETEEAEALP